VKQAQALHEFDTRRIVDYWLTEADEAWQVANHLVASGDHSYALFFGHLTVEKTLKALYAARMEQHAPPIHHLLRLARLMGLEPDPIQVEALLTITAFNIEARYPDLKRAFRAQCTPEFTMHQMTLIKETLQWLKLLFPSGLASNAL
jgi:HEPN domain-containing protein